MDENLKKLESILELVDTKSTMAEFVKAFELAIGYIVDMKSENADERQALQEQVSNSLSKAQERLRTDSTNEWSRMWAKVGELTNGLDGKDGKDGRDGRDGRDAVDGKDGKSGKDGSQDTPDQVIEKINSSSSLIKSERVEGLLDIIRNVAASAVASVGITTSFFNGLRAKNLTIVGATVRQQGDTVFATISTTGGGQVNTVVAGTGISVDSTDPANPIVSVTGASSFAVLIPSAGSVDSSNRIFTFATAPKVVILDNANIMNKVSSDGSVNWTGTTTITLAVAPNFNIYAF